MAGRLAYLHKSAQCRAVEDLAISWIEAGGVTSPQGFSAGAVYAGVKDYGEVAGRLDVALLSSTVPCQAAGVFTQSRVPGAPVTVSREHLRDGQAQAVVVNSGCANVALGKRGVADARRMASCAGEKLGVAVQDVLVASTGVIGRPLPMPKIEAGLAALTLSDDSAGGAAFARAIMTTDTVPKSRAASATLPDGRVVTVGGSAKGSGMAHPNMATVFCFLTTDAPVSAAVLQPMLKRVADLSLNMVDVDMDTSTSDSMAVLANGLVGGAPVGGDSPEARVLETLLTAVAVELARELARDGEGANTLIEATVEGARSVEDARMAARTIVSSPLIKTMVTGRDPNLGRVMMALGRCGAEVEVERVSIYIFDSCAFRNGEPSEVDYAKLSKAMDVPEVKLRVDLGLGDGRATAWGCDLTADYVRINAEYTT